MQKGVYFLPMFSTVVLEIFRLLVTLRCSLGRRRLEGRVARGDGYRFVQCFSA